MDAGQVEGADGAPSACPVCGGDCNGMPAVPLPSDYPFLSEAQMAEHPTRDEDEQPVEPARRRRDRDRQRTQGRRAKHGPDEDRAKKPTEDREPQ